MRTRHPRQFRRGDIVKVNDGPAEVIETFYALRPPLVFVMEKRTLRVEFISHNDVEFVRHATESELSIFSRRKAL